MLSYLYAAAPFPRPSRRARPNRARWCRRAGTTQAGETRQYPAPHARRSREQEGARRMVPSQARPSCAQRASRPGAALRDSRVRLRQRGFASAPARSCAPARGVSGILAVVHGDCRPARDRRTKGTAERAILQRARMVACRWLGARLPRGAALRFSKCDRRRSGKGHSSRVREGTHPAARCTTRVASGVSTAI